MRELTLNDEDEEDGAVAGVVNNGQVRRAVKLKTYSFKRPQFMKKLTNTYFKKSKQSEKAVIMHKELTSQKLHFSMHKKNTKSLSERNNQYKLQKLSKPFTEDMMELPEKSPDGKSSQNAKHKDQTPDSSGCMRLAQIEQELAEVISVVPVKSDNYKTAAAVNKNTNGVEVTKGGTNKQHTRCRSYMKLPDYANPDAIARSEAKKQA